jgi:hypothetical protein
MSGHWLFGGIFWPLHDVIRRDFDDAPFQKHESVSRRRFEIMKRVLFPYFSKNAFLDRSSAEHISVAWDFLGEAAPRGRDLDMFESTSNISDMFD